jgi:hypothetical protein
MNFIEDILLNSDLTISMGIIGGIAILIILMFI